MHRTEWEKSLKVQTKKAVSEKKAEKSKFKEGKQDVKKKDNPLES